MPAESYIQWCNENEGRAYPVSETATQTDAQGFALPSDILADMCIMVPPEYADARVSFVRVTDHLISISIAAGHVGLLHCSVARASYVPYTAVQLTPLADDVSGWVVLGNHIPTGPHNYKFDTGAQSGLAPRAVRVVERVPVQACALLNGDPANAIMGLLQLLGGAAIRVYRKPGTTDTIVVELDKGRAEAFLGPCEPYGCAAPLICSIAGVTADENGTITLRFEGTP